MKQVDTGTRYRSENPNQKLQPTHSILLATIASLFAALSPVLAAASSEIPMESTYESTPAGSTSVDAKLLGGSSDILVVKPEDAKIFALTENAFLEIVIEPSIYKVFWDGVRDGTFEYLSIDDCRFFVTYAPHSNSIYAYDWLGLQYLVTARPFN